MCELAFLHMVFNIFLHMLEKKMVEVFEHQLKVKNLSVWQAVQMKTITVTVKYDKLFIGIIFEYQRY